MSCSLLRTTKVKLDFWYRDNRCMHYRYTDGVIAGGCHRYQKTRGVNSNPTVPHTCYCVSKNSNVSLLYPMLVDRKMLGCHEGGHTKRGVGI